MCYRHNLDGPEEGRGARWVLEDNYDGLANWTRCGCFGPREAV
jgi:hypothetical protein